MRFHFSAGSLANTWALVDEAASAFCFYASQPLLGCYWNGVALFVPNFFRCQRRLRTNLQYWAVVYCSWALRRVYKYREIRTHVYIYIEKRRDGDNIEVSSRSVGQRDEDRAIDACRRLRAGLGYRSPKAHSRRNAPEDLPFQFDSSSLSLSSRSRPSRCRVDERRRGAGGQRRAIEVHGRVAPAEHHVLGARPAQQPRARHDLAERDEQQQVQHRRGALERRLGAELRHHHDARDSRLPARGQERLRLRGHQFPRNGRSDHSNLRYRPLQSSLTRLMIQLFKIPQK